MDATRTMTPLRASSPDTNPMRRMLTARSSRLYPRPRDRLVRMTSPSRISTPHRTVRSRSATPAATVDFPALGSPVSQTVAPPVQGTDDGWTCVVSLTVASASGSGGQSAGLEDAPLRGTEGDQLHPDADDEDEDDRRDHRGHVRERLPLVEVGTQPEPEAR